MTQPTDITQTARRPRKRVLAGVFAAIAVTAGGVAGQMTNSAEASVPTDTAARFLEMQSVNELDTVSFHDIEMSTAKKTVVDAALQDAAEQQCLAEGIYFEARSESVAGQKAVAEVIKNRVESRFYPSTICGVVYQGSQRALSEGKVNCQFRFACDGSMDRWTPTGIAWERAQHLAAISLADGFAPITNEATHYHANYVRPGWSRRLKRTKRVGVHTFYQDLPFRRLSHQRKLAAAKATPSVSAAP